MYVALNTISTTRAQGVSDLQSSLLLDASLSNARGEEGLQSSLLWHFKNENCHEGRGVFAPFSDSACLVIMSSSIHRLLHYL